MNLRKNVLVAVGMALALFMTSQASAVVIDVIALTNSTSGVGVGASTSTGVFLTAGDAFTATADVGDLWNAGNLPRWSNADGLTGDLFATGSDDSGESAGTLIGQDFGLWNQHGMALPFGTLVGSIAGNFFAIGTNFAGNAIATGELLLWYWDVNSFDNTEKIAVTLNIPAPVPEPSSLALLGAGLLGLGFMRLRRAA